MASGIYEREGIEAKRCIKVTLGVKFEKFNKQRVVSERVERKLRRGNGAKSYIKRDVVWILIKNRYMIGLF